MPVEIELVKRAIREVLCSMSAIFARGYFTVSRINSVLADIVMTRA
jgi:hypothetical protein